MASRALTLHVPPGPLHPPSLHSNSSSPSPLSHKQPLSVSQLSPVVARHARFTGVTRRTRAGLQRTKSLRKQAGLARGLSLRHIKHGFCIQRRLQVATLGRLASLRAAHHPHHRFIFLGSSFVGSSLRRARSMSPVHLLLEDRLRKAQSLPAGLRTRGLVVAQAAPIGATVPAMLVGADLSDKSTATSLSSSYNAMMQSAMQNPYEYHHEQGMYYTRILDNLIVGSQPQTPEDVDRLFFEESVTAIVNLQQDHDIAFWHVNINEIQQRAQDLGMKHIRKPARDFDGNSLRRELPGIASVLHELLSSGHKVYIHCTAGLGRAPGAAIAYLYWFSDMDLNQAYQFLTARRPCGPSKDAIRGATFDLVKGANTWERFENLQCHAFCGMAPWERQLVREKVQNQWFHSHK